MIPSMGIKREKANSGLYFEVCATKKIKSMSSPVMWECIAQRKAGETWLKGANFIFLLSRKQRNMNPA